MFQGRGANQLHVIYELFCSLSKKIILNVLSARPSSNQVTNLWCIWRNIVSPDGSLALQIILYRPTCITRNDSHSLYYIPTIY